MQIAISCFFLQCTVLTDLSFSRSLCTMSVWWVLLNQTTGLCYSKGDVCLKSSEPVLANVYCVHVGYNSNSHPLFSSLSHLYCCGAIVPSTKNTIWDNYTVHTGKYILWWTTQTNIFLSVAFILYENLWVLFSFTLWHSLFFVVIVVWEGNCI